MIQAPIKEACEFKNGEDSRFVWEFFHVPLQIQTQLRSFRARDAVLKTPAEQQEHDTSINTELSGGQQVWRATNLSVFVRGGLGTRIRFLNPAPKRNTTPISYGAADETCARQKHRIPCAHVNDVDRRPFGSCNAQGAIAR